jgi:hypothetical protein
MRGNYIDPQGWDYPTVREQNKTLDSIGFGEPPAENALGQAPTEGFEALPSGSFLPIIAPNDNVGYTRALGINNSGTIVGDYEEYADSTYGVAFP